MYLCVDGSNAKGYQERRGKWEKKERQEEGMSFLILGLSISAVEPLVSKIAKSSQLLTKEPFTYLPFVRLLDNWMNNRVETRMRGETHLPLDAKFKQTPKSKLIQNRTNITNFFSCDSWSNTAL